MTATSGQAELKTKYPIEEGLTARTTRQDGSVHELVPDEDLTSENDRMGC
jgi:hypothetical protein